jgi:hypothetical protein
MDDKDIWWSAQLLIQQHGAEAAVRAARTAEDRRAIGDIGGHRIWTRIAKAAADLLGIDKVGTPN